MNQSGGVTAAIKRVYRNRLLFVGALILVPLCCLIWFLIHDLRIAGALAEIDRSYDRLEGEFNALAARSRTIDPDVIYVRYDSGDVLAVPADSARNLKGNRAQIEPIFIGEKHLLFTLKQQMEQRWAGMLGLDKDRQMTLNTAYSSSLVLHFAKTK